VNGLEDQLAQLTDQLTADGVQTPMGEPYTVDALANLRDTAMAWPMNARHDEAAYRTHQEAGSPSTDRGKVLAVLCAVARGERVRRPNAADPDNWGVAVERVQTKLARPRVPRFPIAANDLRVATNRTPNVPGPSRNPHGAPPATPEQVAAVLADPEQREAAMQHLADTDRDLANTVAISAIRAGHHVDDPVDAGIRADVRDQGNRDLAAINRQRNRLTLETMLGSILRDTRAAVQIAQAGDPGVFSDLDRQIDTILTMLSGLRSIVTGDAVITDGDLAALLGGE
jgi:hypothetical protein